MKVYTTPTHYILNPDCYNITKETAIFLGIAYKSMPKDKKVAFDFSVVKQCSNNMFLMFKDISQEREVSVINMDEKIMSSLCIMKYDKYVKLFAYEEDLFTDKREVKNRRFALVGV